MTQTILSRAPGKAILLGEYAVLEGAPALVAAVDRFAEVSVTFPSAEFTVSSPVIAPAPIHFQISEHGVVTYPHGTPHSVWEKLAFFSATLAFGWQELHSQKRSLPRAFIRLNTSDFFLSGNHIKVGRGSSAALTVALLAALFRSAGLHLENEEDRLYLFRTALQAHREAQGKIGSGIDIAASTFGGELCYQVMKEALTPPTLIEERLLPEQLYFGFIWTGKSASTRELVARVNRFKSAQPESYGRIIERMSELSNKGSEALAENNVEQFLDAVSQYYRSMEELGRKSQAPIISREHRELARIIDAAGGVYKPSGAGGGDLGIAFADSPQTMEAIQKRLSHSPFKIVPLTIVQKGVQTSYEKEK